MKYLLFSIVLLLMNNVHGQFIRTEVILPGKPATLVSVNNFKTDENHLFINSEKIESLEVMSEADAVSKFGEAGKSGAILLQPKKSAELLQFDQILDQFNIKGKDRNLRVCINKILTRNPQLILIEKSQIEKVEITQDYRWSDPQDSNAGEKVINIVVKE